ncbi:MAG: cobalamin-dependent protein [Candidatus Coatesbacteria bacterium]|nr:cobalamin-dependent protein [Candidatus Coatesbacteria bacterium]
MGGLEKSSVQHPVNILSLAAHLLANDIETRIIDFEVESLTDDAFLDRVSDFGPDLVGFTCLSPTVVAANRLAGAIKSHLPETFIVAGGPHISAMPERALKEFENFDAGVFGEGEHTLLEICGRVDECKPPKLDGVAGVAHRKGSEFVIEEKRPLIGDLDTLAFPARHLLNLDLYRAGSTPGVGDTATNSTVLFTSRGCAEDCTFCASKITFSRKLRFRSAEHVLAEVKDCIENFGFDHFTIDDDTFTLNKARLTKILEGFSELRVSWDCDTRVNAVDEEMLQDMKAAGCKKVAFGIESGSERIRALIKKRTTQEQIIRAFDAAKRAGLVTQAFFIIGSHPSETLDEVKMTLKLAKRVAPDFIIVNVVTPFPGTELYEMMQAGGYMPETLDWEKFDCTHTQPSWRTEHFSSDELVRLQRWFYLRYSFSPSFMLATLRRINSLKALKYYASTAVGFFKYLLFEKRR